MITTKADKLLRSLIDAGLSLTEFTILATKILRIQRELKLDDENRIQRNRLRKQEKLREENAFQQQIQDELQRRKESRKKLEELGLLSTDDMTSNASNQNLDNQSRENYSLSPYLKQINVMKQKQRDCCLTFNIDYDLRRNQQTLERACRRAKRNIYELRAERFHRPEHRAILSVETVTLYNKLKESIKEINNMLNESKSDDDKRYFQELLTYINQFEGDIDLLMCQMQYEPKVKETILFSPVTTDILDRMNLILHHVRTVAQQISSGEVLNDSMQNDENLDDLSNLPEKVNYIIKIKTNDEPSSSLSDETNVNIRLYGTHSKSPDIRLLQSINKTKWQSGQIDLFNIELNYLGDIYAVEMGHDSEYSSWKIDWIEVIDDAANVCRFPVDRLIAKQADEKKSQAIIQRDVGPVNRLPTKPDKQSKPYKQIGFSTYTVKVKTGKQPNKVTDSSVFIQMKGENGEFSDQLYSANSAFKSSVFEPDQLDTFYLVWPHLGDLESLSLLVKPNGNQPVWFCEYVLVEDSQTGDKYKFVVNQLLNGSNSEDQNLKKHITVYPENTNQQQSKKEEKDKPAYLMKIKTGEKGLSNNSTSPSIKVLLNGDRNKTESYILKPSDTKRKPFQENQTDEFVIPSKNYVGPIKNLQLSSDDQTDPWFIENIIMRDIAQGKDYVFPVYKWFKKQDGTENALTIQPLNERKPDYKIYTRTIQSEMKGPDRSIKVLLQGTKGKQEVELNNPVSLNNTFQPGKKDEFYVENLKSLGDLQSIQVDVTHLNIKKLGLDYIEVKDVATNNTYKFNINRMLDAKNPKMTAKADLILSTISQPSSVKINPSSNKTNFDKLTVNVPQGSKRYDQKSDQSTKQKDYSTKLEDNSLKEKIDDLDYDEDHVEIKKTIKSKTNNDSRENIRPQGTARSAAISTKSTVSPYSKLVKTNDDDDDDHSLSSQTINSSISENLSKETSHSSDTFVNRVESNLKEELIDEKSQASLHEADWYRRSIETNKDHRNDVKQIRLNEKQYVSQTQFDHRQANLIENHYEDHRKTTRQETKDKKTSSQSLEKHEESRKLPLNHEELPNNHQTKKHFIKTKREKFLHAQTSPIIQESDSNHVIPKNYVETVDDRIDTRLARDNPNAFNEQSSTKSSSYTHSDIQQKHSLSSISSKLSVNSTHPDHLSNQSSQTSRTNTIPMNLSKQQAQLTATDSNSNEHIVLSNRENISAVTIHTTTTKSDTDLQLLKKMNNDRESEYSSDSRSLLSPVSTKKSSSKQKQSQRSISTSDSSINKQIDNLTMSPTSNYLSKETSEIQYASRPISSQMQVDETVLSIEQKSSSVINDHLHESHDSISESFRSHSDERLTSKDHPQSISSVGSDISKKHSSKHFDMDHMSTVYEESEPSSISAHNRVKSSVPIYESRPMNIQKSKIISSQTSPIRNQKSKEKSFSNLLPRSSFGSNHHKKTIDAKSIITTVKSSTSVDYEFRVQTGNESHLDGTKESVSIELINTKGQILRIPLTNSMNNSKPFQKGQLDIFHFNTPMNFQQVKKIKLFLPNTSKDPLHIRYCELQERQSMNTFYFPIEQWLGHKTTHHIEMHINHSLI